MYRTNLQNIPFLQSLCLPTLSPRVWRQVLTPALKSQHQRTLMNFIHTWHNKHECTIDQELADAAAYRRPADSACAFTRWQHFSAWNDVMTAILKLRHVNRGIFSLLEEQAPLCHFKRLCIISSASVSFHLTLWRYINFIIIIIINMLPDLKWRRLRLFWTASPEQEDQEQEQDE